jgi:hypothetical protein
LADLKKTKIVIFLLTVSERVIFLLAEEKFLLDINQSESRIVCGGHV